MQIGQTSNASPMLFNILEDPSEKEDLASAQKEKVKELMALILKSNRSAILARDRDPIDPRSNPQLHNGSWVPWEN